MAKKHEWGQLREYAYDRELRKRLEEVFVLSAELDERKLHDTLALIFGPGGLEWSEGHGRVDRMATWDTGVEDYGMQALFRMRFD